MSSIEFGRQVDQFSSVLQGFAYSLTKNSEEAKDLCQETAFRAIKNRDKYKPGTNLKAWLCTIMRNIFINNYRKKTKANTFLDATENMYYINSGKVVIDNKGESNIMMRELTHMIDCLNDNLKVPFMLHYQGFKYDEIATQLDVPLGTVKSRIFFARKELRELVKKRYENII